MSAPPANTAPAACSAAPAALAAAPPFLEGRPAEALSLVVFAGGAVWFSEALPLLPIHRAVLAVAGTGLGLVAAGIERGEARRLTWPGACALAGLAAAVHLLAVFAARGAAPAALDALLRAAALLAVGAPAARLASRLDRREAGWRAAARRGPPHGASPLGDALATRPLPLPLRAVGWLLWPLDLALRGVSLAAIFLYQLSLSRLMPSACRYEPSCSRYGFAAYWQHGFVRASLLTAWRLVRCSPVGSGGYDPMVAPHRRAPGPAAEESGSKGARR